MAETRSGREGRLSRRPACPPLPEHLRRAPDVSNRREQVVAGRPSGPLLTCAREKVRLDLDYQACRWFPFSKQRMSNARFITEEPELSITLKDKTPQIPPL